MTSKARDLSKFPNEIDGVNVTGGTVNPTTLQQGGSQAYVRSNILGTVSQSGGVPTGAIIQRGSNANGEFVKYADGTLICRTTFSAPTVGGLFGGAIPNMFRHQISITLPASFADNINGYAGQSVDSNTTGFVHDAFNGGFSYESLNTNQPATAIRIVWIGRWF